MSRKASVVVIGFALALLILALLFALSPRSKQAEMLPQLDARQIAAMSDPLLRSDRMSSREAAHLFEVSLRIDRPDPAGQVLSLPAWIPGSYMIRDYARHVIDVDAESGGKPVALRKTDKSTWRAGVCEGPLLVRAVIFANDLSVRGAYLEELQAFLDDAQRDAASRDLRYELARTSEAPAALLRRALPVGALAGGRR